MPRTGAYVTRISYRVEATSGNRRFPCGYVVDLRRTFIKHAPKKMSTSVKLAELNSRAAELLEKRFENGVPLEIDRSAIDGGSAPRRLYTMRSEIAVNTAGCAFRVVIPPSRSFSSPRAEPDNVSARPPAQSRPYLARPHY